MIKKKNKQQTTNKPNQTKKQFYYVYLNQLLPVTYQVFQKQRRIGKRQQINNSSYFNVSFFGKHTETL